MRSKPFYKSKTIWGSVTAIISSMIFFFISNNANDKYFSIITTVSAFEALIGRIVSDTKIENIHKRKRNDSNNNDD